MGVRKGYKQAPEHIARRILSSRKTVAGWSDEQKTAFRESLQRRTLNNAGTGNPNWRGGRPGACTGCGTGLWIKPSRAVGARHFCSRLCTNQYFKTLTGPLSSRWSGGEAERKCEQCGGSFKVKRADVRRSRTGFCSRGCAGLARRRTAERKVMARLHAVITSQIWGALMEQKAGRKWEALVGFTVLDLKSHIESRWLHGMTWSNWGQSSREHSDRWQIDHIIPKAAFNFKTAEDPQFLECWSLNNLQALWWRDNQVKAARLDYQPSITV